MGKWKERFEDIIIYSWTGFLGIGIAIAVIFGLVQCGSDTYRDLRDLNRVDTLIIRDTIEVHDTVVNGYRDINALQDTLFRVKNKLMMIDMKAKYIDPYNDNPKEIASDLTSLRNYVQDAKRLADVN